TAMSRIRTRMVIWSRIARNAANVDDQRSQAYSLGRDTATVSPRRSAQKSTDSLIRYRQIPAVSDDSREQRSWTPPRCGGVADQATFARPAATRRAMLGARHEPDRNLGCVDGTPDARRGPRALGARAARARGRQHRP